MNCCLLLGSILLIATVVSFPMYQASAYDRLLKEEFQNYVASEGEWPTINSMIISAQKDEGGGVMSRAESMIDGLSDDFGVTSRENICYYLLERPR